MDKSVSSLARLLLEHRHHLGLSQQELAERAGIYASDLSKMERGEKKPARKEVITRLLDGLRLSNKDAREFVKAAGYSETILGRSKYDVSKYPPVAKEIVAKKLQGSYGRWPVVEQDTERNIVAANLLTFSLWEALDELTQESGPNRLLGENIYTVLVRTENFSRISMPAKKNDFWYTLLAVWNKFRDYLPMPTVDAFEDVIEAHPVLKLVLWYGDDIEQDCMYNLDMLPPRASPQASEPEVYLKFQIEAERVMDGEEHTGYLASFRPIESFTQKWVDEEYTRLIKAYGDEKFVQREPDTHLAEEERKYPSFFPAVHHDKLWNINFVNRAFILLFGKDKDFLNQHYFEMLLSPHVIELMGGLDKQRLSIPVRHFLQQTKDYANDEQYIQIKDRLLRLPAFQTLLTDLCSAESGDIVMAAMRAPCLSIEVACPFTDRLKLSFDIVARRPYENEADYRITFVPVTNATKVALILLRLQKNEFVLSSVGRTEYEQLLWLWVILKTIREGLTKKRGKTDWSWHPEQIFEKLYSTLTGPTGQDDVTTLEILKLHIKWDIAQMLFDCENRKEDIIALFDGFMGYFGEKLCFAYDFLLEDLVYTKEQKNEEQ